MASFSFVLALSQLLLSLWASEAFFIAPSSPATHHSSSALSMGLFDGIKKAFDNAEYAAPPEGIKASARHILVKSKGDANTVLGKLSSGAKFATLASEYSTCPSGSRGGSLGSFGPGMMVPAFDKVIFDPKTNVGEVVGPVETKFGYHIIVVDKRTGV